MNVEIEIKPAQRVFALTHLGPYYLIGQTFGRLEAIAGRAGLLARSSVQRVAIYYGDASGKPASELRSEAGIVVDEDATPPPELHEVVLLAGKYARATHVGPYQGLGAAWSELTGTWFSASGHKAGQGLSHELYRKADHAKPAELETDLYLSIA